MANCSKSISDVGGLLLFIWDVILVFENGRLVQKGTHEELIHVNGQYKFLFALN